VLEYVVKLYNNNNSNNNTRFLKIKQTGRATMEVLLPFEKFALGKGAGFKPTERNLHF
jgi:hypothetical protein